VYSRLKKKAKKQIITVVEVGVGNCAGTTKKLLYRFDLLYGQKNRKQRAIRNLSKISQRKTEPFTLFYPRFEKKIANAKAKNWPNNNKISYFQNALNDKIKAALVFISISEIDTYIKLAGKYEEFSNRMDLFGQWKSVADAVALQGFASSPEHTATHAPL
jgi:hypothetical protein